MRTAQVIDDDKFHDECGIFGVFDHPEAANLAYLGLYALQHRGQESAGIAASDGTTLHVEKAMGWVADVFSPERLKRLPGRSAMGHVRYSTAGSSTLRNAQPITATFSRGSIALGHNGNLVNAEALRKELEALGAIFQSTSDSEVILHLIARADREPALRAVVGRPDESALDGRETGGLHRALPAEVQGRRHAGEAPVNRMEVLAPSEASAHVSQEDDAVAFLLEPLSRQPLRVLEQPDHADDGGRQDRPAQRLVVEGDVPARHGDGERPARRGDAVDALLELPHDLGPLG